MDPAQKLRTTSILPTLTPIETLRLVAGNYARLNSGEVGELPKVTLFLSGNNTFTGFVAGIRDEGEASYILFVEHDDSRGQSINIVYLPLWSVVAVKVHEADKFLPLLSGGKIEESATIGIVTLRRKIADEVLRLRTTLQTDIKLEVSWETMTQDDLSLLGLFELIDGFMTAVHEKISDEFKRIAFKNMVAVIRFQNYAEAEIHQDGQILIVRANLKARAHGRFTREEYDDAFETLIAPDDFDDDEEEAESENAV